MNDPPVLHGLRRDLTRELFEELVALQCEVSEILGYLGVSLPALKAWCRKAYRRPLEAMIPMIRQDGFITIRRALFDQLKKSATIISQQYNRLLAASGDDEKARSEAAVRAFTEMVNVPEETVGELFASPPSN